MVTKLQFENCIEKKSDFDIINLKKHVVIKVKSMLL